MSLRNNIIANYLSQIYVTTIGIIVVPFYIMHMGAEVYGLIGFFVLMQSWLTLMDLGLTPTVVRETARFKGGNLTALYFRQVVRALSIVFWTLAVVGGSALYFLADTIATSWLNIESLAPDVVVFALKVMAITVALRWLSGVFRGIIQGCERLVWLSYFNVVLATFRSVGVIAVMNIWGFTPNIFFTYQLIITILEAVILWSTSRSLLPHIDKDIETIGWSLKPVKSVLKFALTIAFTASIWLLITQTDKMVLSGILSLSEYGYFSLAVLVASGIMIISGPVSNAVLPRMTNLFALNKHSEMLEIYRNSTQLVAIIACSAAITLAFFADHLLYAWTGDEQIVQHVTPILRLYVIGNGLLAITSFPYYLQYAKGNLRYHLNGNLVMAGALIPSLIFASSNYGAIGAGYVWCAINFMFLFFWVAYVHSKIEPGLHVKWLLNDVLVIFIPAAVTGYLLNLFDLQLQSRITSFAILVLCGSLIIIISTIFSSLVRNYFVSIFNQRFG
ncbi:Membrane protein involved in the export of O-antigen and teichoic acid [Rheinheimera pacifica]|uniref:Membrane protein involved in the export of O-antigen and teichoic acid n=1 Tax=Rheinheimera pacifica TaxID=173990 RepID=A0A1H6MKJ9_9GAMM|nr:oligosaccharide flippase family protein [Rheinheimera pacifica]SEH99010.1 Membrane protein involved in the export of O-antigen and teichoic acid [Rheinheimera pacifica]